MIYILSASNISARIITRTKLMYFNSITTATNSCVGIAYPSSGAFEPSPLTDFCFFFLSDAQSLVFCTVFCRSLSFNPFSFGHCFACPSIYGSCLRLWYLVNFLSVNKYAQGNLHYNRKNIYKLLGRKS